MTLWDLLTYISRPYPTLLDPGIDNSKTEAGRRWGWITGTARSGTADTEYGACASHTTSIPDVIGHQQIIQVTIHCIVVFALTQMEYTYVDHRSHLHASSRCCIQRNSFRGTVTQSWVQRKNNLLYGALVIFTNMAFAQKSEASSVQHSLAPLVSTATLCNGRTGTGRIVLWT